MQLEKITVGGLVDATRQELVRVGYTESTRTVFERTWKHLQSYARANHVREFSPGLAQQFLADTYQICRELSQGASGINERRLQAIKVLLDVQNGQNIPIRRTQKQYLFAQRFQSSFDAFFGYRQDSGISYRTLKTDTLYLERFSAYLDERGIKEVFDIDGALVVDFLRWCSATYSQATLYCMAATLRAFFSVCARQRVDLK